MADRDAAVREISSEISRVKAYATARGWRVAVRLNGTSDLRWEAFAASLFSEHADVNFYDYTKVSDRVTNPNLPANYTLVYSRSERAGSERMARFVLAMGFNVAIVFNTRRGQSLPATWGGYPVIDGDETDLRYLDPAGSVVGLRAKGRARSAVAGGFVVDAGSAR